MTIPGAEVHARRATTSSTSITTARSRLTPTPARSCGTTSTSSITGTSIIRSSGCSSTRPSRRTRSEVTWINPKVRAGRAPQGGHRHSRQDRHRLHARSADRRIPLGAADRAAERHQQHRRRDRQGDRQSAKRSSRSSTKRRFVCPGSNGGKNWPAGAYSPLTNTMYMPLQNICMTATTTTDQRDPSKVYGLSMKSAARARRRQGRHRVGDLGRDRHDDVEARAARRHDVARRDGRRAGLRRRRQRPVQGARRQDRQGALGDEPRLAGRAAIRSRSRSTASSTSRSSRGRRSRPTPTSARRPSSGSRNAPGIFVFALP